MTDRMGRKGTLTGLTAAALLAFAAFAPVASAQVPGLGGGSGSGGGGLTKTVTDTVDNVVEGTNNELETPETPVGKIVDQTGTAVDEVTNGNTYEQTKKVVQNTTSGTGDAVRRATNSAGDAVENVGNGITNPELHVKSPLKRKPGDKAATGGAGSTQKQTAVQRAAEHVRDIRQDAKNSAMANIERNHREMSEVMPASATVPQRESFIDQLAEAAGEAAQKLAFPLGLALMVGAFLMVQGRIDRKDAKLALAPIDSEQDLLSFQ